MPKQFFDTAELMETFNITQEQLTSLVNDGTLREFRDGGRIVYKIEEVQRIIGPTGDFPRGKIHESDEGGLAIAVAADPKTNTVILDFGKPTKWIGLAKKDVNMLCEMLQDKANEIE